jgi:hypothetical protein
MLERYRPRQAYLLLDEQQLAKAGALPERNLCTALFRLEASCGANETLTILQALVDWLKAPEQTGLRRAFAPSGSGASFCPNACRASQCRRSTI